MVGVKPKSIIIWPEHFLTYFSLTLCHPRGSPPPPASCFLPNYYNTSFTMDLRYLVYVQSVYTEIQRTSVFGFIILNWQWETKWITLLCTNTLILCTWVSGAGGWVSYFEIKEAYRPLWSPLILDIIIWSGPSDVSGPRHNRLMLWAGDIKSGGFKPEIGGHIAGGGLKPPLWDASDHRLNSYSLTIYRGCSFKEYFINPIVLIIRNM